MSNPEALAAARARDSDARRKRVLHAIDHASAIGSALSVSAVARAAQVHRSFIHRHRDLHAAIDAARRQTSPPGGLTAVTDTSLRTDLTNLKAQNQRLTRHISQLEKRMSQLLGEQVYRASGIGAPAADEELRQHVNHLNQRVTDLRQALEERTDELAAARAANRELMTLLNRS